MVGENRVQRAFFTSTGLSAIFVILIAGLIYTALIANMLSQKIGFSILTILLIFFLFFEIMHLRRIQPTRWLLNPVVVCSMVAFFLYFGITNILYFFPRDSIILIELSPDITLEMNKLMFIVILGAVAMWLGYWSSLATRVVNSKVLMHLQHKYFDVDAPPRTWVIPVLYLIANFSRFIEVWLGIYGYSATYERIQGTILIAQILIILDNLGLIVLIITSLQYYGKADKYSVKIYFAMILFGELFWGILSGMKSKILLPFLCILMVQYLRNGRLNKTWLIIVPIVILISYSIVTPFREEKNSNPNFEATSVHGIVKAVVDAQVRKIAKSKQVGNKNFDSGIIKGENDANYIIQIMGRTNLISPASIGIDYVDTTKKFPPGSPDFFYNMITAPIGALVPRFIWHDKPVQNIGLWYTQVVMGKTNLFSSTAMSIFTNLYFVGGITAVFIGLFIIGMLQRVIFFVSKPWISSAGVIVYLGLMPKFVFIAEGDSQTIIAFIFRVIPLLLIFQSLIFSHKHSSSQMDHKHE